MARASSSAHPTPARFARRPSPSRGGFITIIAAFKLNKGLLLIALALGTLKLVHGDVEEVVVSWARHLHLRPEGRVISAGLERIGAMQPRTLETAAAGMLGYAALLLTEGVGLFLRKTWAEYLTIVATAVFIPLEVYEVVRHVTATRVAVIIVNVVIVAYLVVRVRRERRSPHP
jgi:uncharacterized membrane protein (DUF2068 family)